MAMNPGGAPRSTSGGRVLRVIDRGDPQSLLEANIFFDFGRCGRGGARRGAADRHRRSREGQSALPEADERHALTVRPPLTGWARLPRGGRPGRRRHRPQGLGDGGVRRRGAHPVSRQRRHRNQHRRAAAGSRRGEGHPESEINAWADAFEYLQFLRLRTQHRRAAGMLPAAESLNLVRSTTSQSSTGASSRKRCVSAASCSNGSKSTTRAERGIRMSIWRKVFSREAAAPADVGRWVVVDTETTGLDVARDTLIAIGGVAVDAEGVVPGDSFEVVLRNAEGPTTTTSWCTASAATRSARACRPPRASRCSRSGWATRSMRAITRFRPRPC